MKSFKSYITDIEEGRCWPGHKPVPGKKPYSPGSCTKEEVEQIDELNKEPGGTLHRYLGSSKQRQRRINAAIENPSKLKKINTGMKSAETKIDKERKKQTGMNPVRPPSGPGPGPGLGYNPQTNRSYNEEVELDEAIPKTTNYALIHSSSKKIIAKGNKTEMMKKIKELNKKEKGSHHLGMTNRGKVGDTFGEEVELDEVAAWQRKEGKNSEGGLNQKGVESYRRENPGSKLQTAVTTKPSKLDPDSKAAKRRKSFCSRMGGMKKRLTSAKTANDPDSRINKALRKWNC
jgi:hypothetical protein